MANRKIFPTKDASMYTISQSMNTGLDEILEATTKLELSKPQVSRYVLEFSQDEINTWVTSSVSGSTIGTTAGVMVLNDPYLVRPESYQRFETKGLSYPTSSRNKFDAIVEPLYSGSQNPNEPIYIGGSGVGLQLYLATGAGYFKPGVSLSASIAQSNAGTQPADNGTIMTAPNGNYGPFAFNLGGTGALEADTQGATVTLVVENNRFENAFVGTTALTSGAQLFGTDTTEGATPSYGASPTITVLAADLIAAGIQFQGGGMIFNQNILSITGGAAKTAMGGQTGPFLVTLLPSMVSGGIIQTGDSAIVSLTADAGGNLTVATVDTAGFLYVDGNIITIPATTLIAAGFTGAVGILTITLTAANITENVATNDVSFNNGFGQLDDDWGVFPIITLAANYDSKLSRGKGYKVSDRLYIPSQSFHGSEDYYFELDKVNAGATPNTDNFGPVEHKITMDNYAAVVTGLIDDQTLQVRAVSGSWNMGTGKYANSPVTTNGVSWEYRNYSGSIAEGATKWAKSGPITVASDQQILNTVTTTLNGTATGIAGDGSRSGTSALFSIESTGLKITKVTCTTAGTEYIPGDTITITKAVLDAAPANLGTVSGDLIFKVTNVDGFGSYSEASWSGSIDGAGGNWYTGSNYGLDVEQEKIFSYGQGIDLDIDVTNTIKTWYTNSLGGKAADNVTPLGFSNNGFLVKQSSSREFVNNKNTIATFRYFSIDTNTIYPPALNLKWNDYNFATGSSIQKVLATQESFVNIYNNSGTYYSESIPRLRISAIPKYPDVVFQTASLYTNNHYLPYTSSFYAIKDTDTNEYVVPFSDPYTKISADSISSYFDVEMAGLEPERYYTILIKSTVGGTVKVFDEDIMFKVING